MLIQLANWVLSVLSQALPPSLSLPVAAGAPAPSQHEPNFQAYIFYAYGFVCALLFLFTLWTLIETWKVSKRIDYLTERFERAHPEVPRDSERGR